MHVHPHLAAGAPPVVAKGEVFAQVAAAHRVDERVKKSLHASGCHGWIGVRSGNSRRFFIDIALDEPRGGDRLEDSAGDQHESRADVRHPHKPRFHAAVKRLVWKCLPLLPHAEGIVVREPL